MSRRPPRFFGCSMSHSCFPGLHRSGASNSAGSQSCGVPVIGAHSGAIPDVIGDGGWVVPERDVDALTELFDRLASAPEELAKKRASGLANVASRFTFQIIAQILAKAWKEAHVRCVTSASQPDTSACHHNVMRH